jgi:hypothetical protein
MMDRMVAYCVECAIRTCGLERGVENCAYCNDYACPKLLDFFKLVPQAQAVLEEIRTSF